MHKNFVRFAINIFLITAIAGCATMPMDPMTREQWQLETKRIYKDVSAEEVFESAEKLFKLWDGEDFTFGYADNEITATRSYMVFVVINYVDGRDRWRVAVEPIDENSLEVSVNLAVSISTLGFYDTININTPYIYRLFWSRMDYLLGKSDKWFSCKDWKATHGVGLTEMGTPCNALAKDAIPTSVQSN